jgi:hypothetical protein
MVRQLAGAPFELCEAPSYDRLARSVVDHRELVRLTG